MKLSKKLVSAAICASMLLPCGTFGLAADNTNAKCSIEQTDLSVLTVKVKSDKSSFSVMVFPKGKTYTDLLDASEWSADIVVYAREFKNNGTTEFKMDLSNTRSGDYTLYLSEGGEVSQYDFKFVRKDMKDEVYKRINASASADEITDILDYAYLDLGLADDEWNAADKSGISSKLWDIKQGGFTFSDSDNGKSDEYLFSAIVIDLLNKSKLTNIFNFTENLNMANTEMKNRYKKDSVTSGIQSDITKRMSAKSIKDYNDLITKFKDAVILGIVGGADNYIPVKEVITEFSTYIGVQTSRLSDSVYSAVQGNNFSTIAALADDLKLRYGTSNSDNGSGGSGGSGGGGRGSSIKADNVTEVVPPEKMPTDIFVDLDSVEWAREAIVSLAEKRVVCGKKDKLFYPNDTITRYEFAKIVSNAFLTDKSGDRGIPFVDVPKDFWAYEYVKTAYSNGVILGKSDDAFDGDAVITRQEMAAILYRAAQNVGKTLSDYESAKDYRFKDDAAIDDYAKEPVYVLRRDGVINGVGDDMFAPLDIATRAEAAQMVYLMQSL
jgi:hypothetical protein